MPTAQNILPNCSAKFCKYFPWIPGQLYNNIPPSHYSIIFSWKNDKYLLLRSDGNKNRGAMHSLSPSFSLCLSLFPPLSLSLSLSLSISCSRQNEPRKRRWTHPRPACGWWCTRYRSPAEYHTNIFSILLFGLNVAQFLDCAKSFVSYTVLNFVIMKKGIQSFRIFRMRKLF